MQTLLITIFLALLCLCPANATAQTPEKYASGALQTPQTTEHIGTFNKVAYVRYTGQFTGVTQSGSFVVPYEVTVPLDPADANGLFIFAPPQLGADLVAHDSYLGSRFVFAHGFSHASVGFGNLIESGEVTDTEILEQFVRALNETKLPFPAQVNRVYAIGYSDSGNEVCIQDGEADFYYAIAGAPHIADATATLETLAEEWDTSVAGTTPINWLPFVRALLISRSRY